MYLHSTRIHVKPYLDSKSTGVMIKEGVGERAGVASHSGRDLRAFDFRNLNFLIKNRLEC